MKTLKPILALLALVFSACTQTATTFQPQAVSEATPVEVSRAWVNSQIAAGKTSPTLSDPACMLPASIPAVSITGGGFCVTLVHPQIIEFSQHFRPLPSWTVDFGGQTYVIAKTAWTDTGPDIAFGLLDRPVVGVKPMRMLLAPDNSFLRLPVFWYSWHRNKMQLLEVASYNTSYTWYVGKAISLSSPVDPAWRIGTSLIGGDSGSPLIARVDGEWVVLGTAQSPRLCSGIHNYYPWARQMWKTNFGIDAGYQTITLRPGDANDDGRVDFADFAILSNNYGKATDRGHNTGDFNRSGKVDGADYTILSNNYGK